MEATHQSQKVKCPNCSCNINCTVGSFRGGINDYGGWILECSSCNTKFPLNVKNPDDASSVLSGAKIIASWDDEVEGDRDFKFNKHGISVESTSDLMRVLVVDVGEKDDIKFNFDGSPLYLCSSCGSSIEAKAYSELSKNLMFVNKEIQCFLMAYLKGHENEPSGVVVSQSLHCSCGQRIAAKFYKKFVESEFPVQDHAEFLLVDAHSSLIDVDGIYTRDECFELLEKLLIRWGCVHNLVMLVVPFIGFDYKGTEGKRLDLWDRVLKHTIPEKTAIITRKATFTSFKEAANNQGLDIAFLKNYELLNPTLAEMTEKNAQFKRDFHAKFYCGISGDNVEVLHGSFNIHDGGYVENIQFKEYKLPDFLRRYIVKLGVFINRELLVKNENILVINSDVGGVFSHKMVSSSVSLAEILKSP